MDSMAKRIASMDEKVHNGEGKVTIVKKMKENNPSMYEECMWQYAEMANGGKADDGTGTLIRDSYYAGYPDAFFFRVLSGLGEFERFVKECNPSIGIP